MDLGVIGRELVELEDCVELEPSESGLVPGELEELLVDAVDGGVLREVTPGGAGALNV